MIRTKLTNTQYVMRANCVSVPIRNVYEMYVVTGIERYTDTTVSFHNNNLFNQLMTFFTQNEEHGAGGKTQIK